MELDTPGAIARGGCAHLPAENEFFADQHKSHEALGKMLGEARRSAKDGEGLDTFVLYPSERRISPNAETELMKGAPGFYVTVAAKSFSARHTKFHRPKVSACGAACSS
jgi:hypothetical protein